MLPECREAAHAPRMLANSFAGHGALFLRARCGLECCGSWPALGLAARLFPREPFSGQRCARLDWGMFQRASGWPRSFVLRGLPRSCLVERCMIVGSSISAWQHVRDSIVKTLGLWTHSGLCRCFTLWTHSGLCRCWHCNKGPESLWTVPLLALHRRPLCCCWCVRGDAEFILDLERGYSNGQSWKHSVEKKTSVFKF